MNQGKDQMEMKRDDLDRFVDLTNAWFNGRLMNFPEDQRDFLKKHGISISTAYIGMVRLYKDGRTIWQTNPFKPILDAVSEREGFCTVFMKSDSELFADAVEDYKSLSRSCIDYVSELMNMSNEELDIILSRSLSLF